MSYHSETKWDPVGLLGIEAFLIPCFLQARLQNPQLSLRSKGQIQTVAH